PPPQVLVSIEQAPGDAKALDVGADDLAPPVPLLRNQPRSLEHGDVLLHGREAHRVMQRQLGDAFIAGDRPTDDVPPRHVGERAEHAVDVGGGFHGYNHTVVLSSCQPPGGPWRNLFLHARMEVVHTPARVARRLPATRWSVASPQAIDHLPVPNPARVTAPGSRSRT